MEKISRKRWRLVSAQILVFEIVFSAGTVSADQLKGLGTLANTSVYVGSSVLDTNSTGTISVGAVIPPGGDLPFGGALGLVIPQPQAAKWSVDQGVQELGYLPNTAQEFSLANSVSSDGNIVVGIGVNQSNHYEAFRWTQASGMVGLGYLPINDQIGSVATAISDDGRVITGSSWDSTNLHRAFRWSEQNGMTTLGSLPGTSIHYSEAYGTNADGSVIVGEAMNASDVREAFRWTEAVGMVGLGLLPNASIAGSFARAVSADGQVVVGVAGNSNGQGEAFRWTQEDGMVGLGILSSAISFGSQANAVNADGSVVVGGFATRMAYDEAAGLFTGYFASQDQLVIAGISNICIFDILLGSGASGSCTPNASPQTTPFSQSITGNGLYVPSPPCEYNANTAQWEISLTASIYMKSIANVCSGSSPEHPDFTQWQTAFRWTETGGLRSIADLLTESGTDIDGWLLSTSTGVSADGSIITGTGINPSGVQEGWWAKIGTGFISVNSLSASLASLTGVGQSTQQSTSGGLGETMNANMNGGVPQSQGTVSAWGGMGASEFNVLKIDPYAFNGTIGITYQSTSSVKIGAGIHYGRRDDELPVLNGATHNQRSGIDLLGAYEPSSAGLRLYGVFVADYLSDQIRRGYLNGVTPASSSGKRTGQATGISAVVGWEIPFSQSLSVMPLVGYEASYFSLRGYTETSGPFPVRVDSTYGTLQIIRAGAKLDGTINAHLELWTSINAAHRVENRMPAVSGQVLALSLPFNIAGASMRQNWAEGSIGALWHVTSVTTFNVSVGATTDGDTSPLASTRLGVSISL